MRSRLQEIERLIPHIDLIITLRERRTDRKSTGGA
jgi:hypothetical protein